ncbi:hypothetical protein [Streptomyces sp. NPDC102462]|uniref:hypothetical protein n=1 Tax=Streptomyces sp. NPDC102462 TaxID=3366178 RepID=UPI0037F66A54
MSTRRSPRPASATGRPGAPFDRQLLVGLRQFRSLPGGPVRVGHVSGRRDLAY